MNKIHEIKLNEKFVDAVLSGDKSFEIRKNDRGYQKGDLIKFIPVDDNGFEKLINPFVSKDIVYVITYVLNGWGIEKEYVVFSFVEVLKKCCMK